MAFDYTDDYMYYDEIASINEMLSNLECEMPPYDEEHLYVVDDDWTGYDEEYYNS